MSSNNNLSDDIEYPILPALDMPNDSQYAYQNLSDNDLPHIINTSDFDGYNEHSILINHHAAHVETTSSTDRWLNARRTFLNYCEHKVEQYEMIKKIHMLLIILIITTGLITSIIGLSLYSIHHCNHKDEHHYHDDVCSPKTYILSVSGFVLWAMAFVLYYIFRWIVNYKIHYYTHNDLMDLSAMENIPTIREHLLSSHFNFDFDTNNLSKLGILSKSLNEQLNDMIKEYRDIKNTKNTKNDINNRLLANWSDRWYHFQQQLAVDLPMVN